MRGLACQHGTSSHPHGRCLALRSSARGELMSGGWGWGGGFYGGGFGGGGGGDFGDC